MHLEIQQDTYSESPREWDNLSTMVCGHNRYELGDIQWDVDRTNSWEEVEQILRKENDIAIIKPLYLYDHSNLSLSYTMICRWDSMQIGYQYATKQQIRDEYQIKRVTKQYIEKAENQMQTELATYNLYINGNVYEYRIMDNDDCLDACGGFYPYPTPEAMVDEMKHYADRWYNELFVNFDISNLY